jgi:aldose 1-epimerase
VLAWVQYRLMQHGESILTLHAGDATATVHPDAGSRIGQITVADQPLLVDVPPVGERTPMAWGSYPMVPWAGRIARGRFVFGGIERQLPINHHDGSGAERAHAIHGLAFDRAWDVHDVPGTSCTCSIRLDWEFRGTATHTVALFDDRIVMTLMVESTGASFPAEVGWHPWFRKPDRLDFAPTAMYERDEFGIPTGRLVPPSAGPWDDCFVNTLPITLHYDRETAPSVTVLSGCDHVVVYDEPADATCVEPQSGPPDAFNLTPHLVAPELTRTMTISW